MSQSSQAPRVVRFGVFDVDLLAGELRKAGLRVRLQQQPFQVLVTLLERPGVLITREELRQRLWPADTFVDFDISLNSALKKVRYALGDDAENPTFIETIPRRGYRFIGTVQHLEVGLTKVERQVLESPRAPGRSAWWWNTAKISSIVLALAAASLLVATGGWRDRSSARAASQRTIQSLAVLPLENLSGDASQDYFADGMTDELITNLGQIHSLRVISRTSAMQYRGVHKPLPQVARELQVDAIVEGTVLRSGDKVRITAQLIQAAEDRHLWAQSFEGDLKDVLVVQENVSRAIASQVQMVLVRGEHIRAGIDRPLNMEAYESYLKGEYYLNRFSAESIQQALVHFQHAVERDPGYAPAYTKMSGCYRILANMGVLSKPEANQKAKALDAKALELDPNFGPAHAGKGWGLLLYDLDFSTAGDEFRRSVELSPNSVEAHQGLGDYYAAMGRLQEAVREVERARELDPLASIVNHDLCQTLKFARRWDEALAQCKANLELNPNSVRTLWVIDDIYTAKGMESEALSYLLRGLKAGAASPKVMTTVEAGASRGGLKGSWQALIPFALEAVRKGEIDAFIVAVIYTRAGNADKAISWLQEALKARSFGISFLLVDPTFDPLRSDPRFVSLLRWMGLPESTS